MSDKEEVEQRLTAHVAGAHSRGAVKRLAAEIDRDPELRAALVARLESREPGEVWDDLDGKRLVRALLDRAGSAQTLRSPLPRDEAFVCAHCGLAVPPHGRTARNHCPSCLRSLHVDVIPGDRAADCGGLLDPIGLEFRHGIPVLHSRCRRCGIEKSNRAAEDGDPPDDGEALRRVAKGEFT